MRSLLRRWRGRPLDAEEAAALATERVERNRRRVVRMGVLMAIVHAVHAWWFHVDDAARASLSAVELRWRDGLFATHAATLVFVAIMTTVAATVRARVVLRGLGIVTVIGYLLHAAVVTGLDQLMSPNMTVYVAYAFGLAFLIASTPLEVVLAHVIGLAALLYALATYAPPGALQTNLPTSITINIVAVCLSWFAEGVRRRDLVQRMTIERQRAELARFNAELEERVRERSAELQGQVRARSTELSLALQRLAQQMASARGLERGAVIADRFVVDEPIGEGGMGRVYAGRDRTTGTRVAIKVLQVTSSKQLDALRRFIHEAGATATVSHPAVVRILAFDVSDDGLLYLVQELVEGHTLARRLDRRWAPGEAARVGAALADALAAAHAQRVVHRDVKPDNVMLTTASPGLKLVDFGVAKLMDAAVSDGATAEQVVIGTPAFMAPEQIQTGAAITDRADVYAVGVILHRMITRELPIEGVGPHELMLRKLRDEAPRIADMPGEYAELVRRCLAREADARPSAAELAESLRALADAAGAPPLEQIAAAGPTGEITVVERKPVAPGP
jgi:hypothetical protein